MQKQNVDLIGFFYASDCRRSNSTVRSNRPEGGKSPPKGKCTYSEISHPKILKYEAETVCLALLVLLFSQTAQGGLGDIRVTV